MSSPAIAPGTSIAFPKPSERLCDPGLSVMQRRAKNTLVVLAGVVLAFLGVYNLVEKATWTVMDDGVFWKQAPQGLVAARLSPGGPAARAGVRAGDVLLAVDGDEVLSPERLDAALGARRRGERLAYTLLRQDERRALTVALQPLPQGNVSGFYYLSLAGFFSLVVGTVVMLRRPAERTSLHFYAICVLFFLMYSTSYTGKLDLFDWIFVWTDHVATLLLPVVFLHFCLTFPERRLGLQRLWLVPALYMPALVVTGAAAMSQALFARGEEPGALWGIVATIDAAKPLYFAALFAVSFGVLLRSYRRTRSLTARRQVKWLVWGTAAGAFPFLAFYALPFALGREPGLAMQLVGYGPLALIPLSLAYAVVKHRLMDVELIFRRSLGYVLAVAVIVGLALLTVGVTDVLWEEPHATLIALLSALVVVLLGTPVKARIQEGLERLSYKERYSSRKALVRLSEDLNADLDLERTCERLLEGIGAALGLREMVVFLPGEDAAFAPFRARGVVRGGDGPRLRAAALLGRLRAGQPIDLDAPHAEHVELTAYGLAWLFPCRVKGEVIAVLGVGRKDALEPLDSEEVDVLKTLAAQAASAILNGRLYRSLSEKADELRGLKDYNENILESLDSGIVVLDLDGRVVRWNRAMEALDGRQRLADARPHARRGVPGGVPRRAARLARARRPRGDRAHLQAAPALLRRAQPDGQRLGRALPVGARRALRHDPDPRRRDRARAARGAAAARREDGLGGPARGRRRARGEHAARRDQLLHPAAARPARGAGPAAGGAREDREAELPRGEDHQRAAELLARERHRVRAGRRQPGAARRAVAGRAPARGLRRSA